MRRLIGLFVAAASAVIATPRAASACTPIPTDYLVIDPAFADDTQAPGVVSTAPVTIYRYEGAGCGDSGCGNYAFIDIPVMALDDRAPAARLGYHLDVVGGSAPRPYWTDGWAIVPDDPTRLRLYFDVEAPAFEFDLSIRAVDLNGNLGPPTVVHIVDTEGSGGCTTAGRHPAAPLVAVALATLLATRRRR